MGAVDAVVRLQTGMQRLELCPGQKFKACFPKTLRYVLSCIHPSMAASQHVHATTYTSINLDHPQVHETFLPSLSTSSPHLPYISSCFIKLSEEISSLISTACPK